MASTTGIPGQPGLEKPLEKRLLTTLINSLLQFEFRTFQLISPTDPRQAQISQETIS